MRYLYLTVLLFFISKDLSFAQSRKEKRAPDSSYIETLNHLLAIKIFPGSKLQGFTIKNTANNQNLKFGVNQNITLGFGVAYKGLGLSASFNLPFLNNDAAKFGKTYGKDIQINTYGRRSNIDLDFIYFKGYYIKNPEQFDHSWKQGTYPKRPDIRTSALGGSYYFLLNHKKFSYRASFLQNEIQKKSVGSVILGGSASLFSIVADSALIPSRLNLFFRNQKIFRSATSYTFGGGIGYAYTQLIKQHFYLTGSFVGGIAWQSFNGITAAGNAITYNLQPALQTLFKFSLGYNRKLFFAGILLTDQSFYFNPSTDLQFRYHFGNLKLFIGKRFKI